MPNHSQCNPNCSVDLSWWSQCQSDSRGRRPGCRPGTKGLRGEEVEDQNQAEREVLEPKW